MVAPWGSRLLSGLARTRAVASASASAGTSTEDSGSWELPSEGEGSTAAPYAMPVSGSMPPVATMIRIADAPAPALAVGSSTTPLTGAGSPPGGPPAGPPGGPPAGPPAAPAPPPPVRRPRAKARVRPRPVRRYAHHEPGDKTIRISLGYQDFAKILVPARTVNDVENGPKFSENFRDLCADILDKFQDNVCYNRNFATEWDLQLGKQAAGVTVLLVSFAALTLTVSLS